MASKATDAADAIKRAAKQYEAFVAAAEILEKIGSLENAVEEAKKDIEAHRKVRDFEASEANKLKEETINIKNANLFLEIEAKAKADEIVNAATLQAYEIGSDAGVAANKTIQDANAKAQAILAGVDSQLVKLEKERSELESSNAGLQALVAESLAKAEEAEKRLAKAQAAIAKLIAA